MLADQRKEQISKAFEAGFVPGEEDEPSQWMVNAYQEWMDAQGSKPSEAGKLIVTGGPMSSLTVLDYFAIHASSSDVAFILHHKLADDPLKARWLFATQMLMLRKLVSLGAIEAFRKTDPQTNGQQFGICRKCGSPAKNLDKGLCDTCLPL